MTEQLPRCEHTAFVGYPSRCQLPAGHEGDHRGGVYFGNDRDAWTHSAKPAAGDTPER